MKREMKNKLVNISAILAGLLAGGMGVGGMLGKLWISYICLGTFIILILAVSWLISKNETKSAKSG